MATGIATLADQFDVGTNLFHKALYGLDREALLRRPSDHSNPLVWIAGHVTQFRVRILSLLGADYVLPWGELFATGSHVAETDLYPSADELRRTWDELSAALALRLRTISDEELAAPPSARVPSPDGTLRGAVTLFAFHEAYHIGQLGYVRKWLGASPLMER